MPAPGVTAQAAAHARPGPVATASPVTASPAATRHATGAAQAASAQAGQAASHRQVLASPWRRLAAFAIDAVILTLVTGALWGRLLASFANRMSKAAGIDPGDPAAHGAVGRVFAATTGPFLMVLVPTIILAILYYWLLTGYWGTTIGKRSAGLWVVSAGDRSPIGLRASFLRALIFVLGGEVVPLFFPVDNGWLLAGGRRQALHDKAAGTLVVRDPPAAR